MNNLENVLKTALQKIGVMNETLKILTLRVESLTPKMQDIAKKHLRKKLFYAKEFEQEFRGFVDDLQTLNNKTTTFWNDTRTKIRSFSDKEMSENAFLIKNFNLEARNLTRRIEEFNSVFRYMHQKFKKLPVELNWWTVEACSLDFDKLCNKMLFLARELTKNIENYKKEKSTQKRR